MPKIVYQTAESYDRKAKPQKFPCTRYVGDNLALYYAAKNLPPVWRLRVRKDGHQTWIIIGERSEKIDFDEAREICKDIRRQIKAGVPPRNVVIHIPEKKKDEEGKENNASDEQNEESSFAAVSQLCIEDGLKMKLYSEETAKNKYGRRKRLLPFIGNRQLADLKKSELYNAVVSPLYEDPPKTELPSDMTNLITATFQYARMHGIIPDTCMPDAQLSKMLPKKPEVKHRPSLQEPQDISNLLVNIDKWYLKCHAPAAGIALKIMPYVALRVSELVEGLWNEIDFEKKLWIIPAERMKMSRPYITPLSTQVIELLQHEKEYFAKDSKFIFPSSYAEKTGHVSGTTLLRALERMGYDTSEEMCVHGFRSMFSTLANKSGLFPSDAIEVQIAHKIRDKIRGSYNFYDYMPERRQIVQIWADYLDALRSGEIMTLRKWARTHGRGMDDDLE